ncbi:hypothetical protein [Streptantibioticus silvisoli]|uniref:Uncharacterized protein n=1 Tax=Streptantibioticus silvisoli TaxID=2705255 RepID=A0ABT6WAI5_9ACTN|nr:hypothetical protein [Streptantibioticus silvisoli]MDI5967353.1 hypothetical protein [Streptantibioticus silvisoli]
MSDETSHTAPAADGRAAAVRRGRVRPWVWGLVVCVAGAFTAYVRAFLAVSGLTDSGGGCGMGRERDFVRLDVRDFPPAARCLLRDGTAHDLVPSWTAPVLVAGLAGALLCAAVALCLTLRRRRTTTPAA